MAVGFGVSAAQAGFVLDLQLTGGGTSTTVGTGSVVSLDVFGTVTGASGNTAAEGLQDAFFGVTNSGTVGDLSLVTLQSPFSGVAVDVTPNVTTSSSGALYGAVGSKSVGSTDSTSATGWVFARSTSMTTVTDGVATKLGTLSFTAGSTAGSTTLAINARAAANALVIPAVWQEDGLEKDGAASVGSSVSITVTAVTIVPGDADGDGDVDGDDIAIWSQNFTGSLAPGTGTATSAMGDFDGDKDVDGDDAAIWSQNFTGSHAPDGISLGLASVPEPASLGLLGVAGLAFLGRRSRKI